MKYAILHGHNRRSGPTPEYRSWQSMIARITDPLHHSFKNYGGRGITLDQRWRTFVNFLSDMGPRPSLLHTLERKNNDLGYTAENCVWATKSQQSRNTRRTRFVFLNNERMCLTDACTISGVSIMSVNRARREKGIDAQTALDNHLTRIHKPAH
jgi:hypothetical protein